MNVLRMNEITRNQGLEAQALEARQWSIINNAVRELTKAIGYEGPFRDNDMRVAMAIKAAAARLHGSDGSTDVEHLPLAPGGAETDPIVTRVTDILENGLDAELRAIAEQVAAQASTPAPAAPTSRASSAKKA